MVPGIYDSIILEKTLFDSMSRDIKEADSSGFKGRALILLKILKKVE